MNVLKAHLSVTMYVSTLMAVMSVDVMMITTFLRISTLAMVSILLFTAKNLDMLTSFFDWLHIKTKTFSVIMITNIFQPSTVDHYLFEVLRTEPSSDTCK